MQTEPQCNENVYPAQICKAQWKDSSNEEHTFKLWTQNKTLLKFFFNWTKFTSGKWLAGVVDCLADQLSAERIITGPKNICETGLGDKHRPLGKHHRGTSCTLFESKWNITQPLRIRVTWKNNYSNLLIYLDYISVYTGAGRQGCCKSWSGQCEVTQTYNILENLHKLPADSCEVSSNVI